MNKKNLLGLAQQQMIEIASGLGEAPFRGKQLYHQIYRRRESRLESMTELPARFREGLSECYTIFLPGVRKRTLSRDGTVKFLFELEDGEPIESVFIPEGNRQTLCISSQVGCDAGCTFCLTAQMGFRRNLTPAEIVGQILVAVREGLLKAQGCNIVFMGMGEPLYNYQNVMRSFRLMVDPSGMDLSYRRITVSTAGVVPVLKKMTREEVLPNLAISLNATANAVRDEIMPINRKWDLQSLLETCRQFPLEPRRRITFEYILIEGVTDSDADAHQLAKLLRGIRSKVNLIPYNPNPGLPFRRPSQPRIERFQEILAAGFVSAFVRRPRGDDISAACGQLAYRERVAHGV